MGCSKSNLKREAYSDTGLSQEARKISDNHPNLPSKGFRKEQGPKSAKGRNQ